MQVRTIESILYVKYNIDSNCIDFYKTLKSRPDILRKILANQKYNILPIPQLSVEDDPSNTATDDPIEIGSNASASGDEEKSDEQSGAALSVFVSRH